MKGNEFAKMRKENALNWLEHKADYLHDIVFRNKICTDRRGLQEFIMELNIYNYCISLIKADIEKEENNEKLS